MGLATRPKVVPFPKPSRAFFLKPFPRVEALLPGVLSGFSPPSAKTKVKSSGQERPLDTPATRPPPPLL